MRIVIKKALIALQIFQRASGRPHRLVRKNYSLLEDFTTTPLIQKGNFLLSARVVIPVVVGSSPISHPKKYKKARFSNRAFFISAAVFVCPFLSAHNGNAVLACMLTFPITERTSCDAVIEPPGQG